MEVKEITEKHDFFYVNSILNCKMQIKVDKAEITIKIVIKTFYEVTFL